MTVHLPPDLEQLIESRVQRGRYGSASDVVRDALRLLADRENLQKRIAEGLESLERGEGLDGDEFFAELREEAALDRKRA